MSSSDPLLRTRARALRPTCILASWIFRGCLALALLSLLAGAVSTQGACLPAPSNLAAWWPGEGNGLDVQGGANGAVQGGVTYVPGTVGDGFRFDGVSGLMALGNGSPFRQFRAITYSFWARIPAGGGGWAMGAGGLAGHGFGGVSVSPTTLSFTWTATTPGGDTGINATGLNLPTDEWMHLAFSVDFFNQTRAFYVNGQAIATTMTATPSNWQPVASYSAGRPDFVGGRFLNTQQYFNGDLDEVDVYPRGLSATEVLSVYQAGAAGKCPTECSAPPSGIVGWWRGEDNASDVLLVNNGQTNSGASFTGGLVGRSFAFDGVNDYVSVPNSPALNTHSGPAGELTVEAWIYMPTVPVGTAAVVSKVGVGAYEYALVVAPNGSTAAAGLAAWGPGGATYASASGVGLSTGVWHHVAGVLKKGQYIRLYLDGALVQESTSFTANMITAGNAPLSIGQRGDGQFFNGRVDEVALYNRALTTTEIQATYSAGQAGKCLPMILAPQTAFVSPGESRSFAPTGGRPPYTFALTANTSGGAVDASGLYTAGPTAGGNDVVTVTDSLGATASATVEVRLCAEPPSGLVSWWRADDNAFDSVRLNHGYANFGATNAEGRVGRAFDFDGLNDYIEIPHSDALSPYTEPSGEMTLETWIYLPQLPTSPTVALVKAGYFGYEYGMIIQPSGQLQFITWGVNRVVYGQVAGGSLASGVWQHVAVVLRTGQYIRLYVNGTLLNESTSFSSATLNRTASSLYLAHYVDGYGGFFKGRLDELALYNRALTGAEVQSIHAAGGLGKCRPLTLVGVPSATYPGATSVLSANGGRPPFTFALTANNSGATLTPAGTYTAGPILGVNDTVQVTDAAGATATATMKVRYCELLPAGQVAWWRGDNNALDSEGTRHGTLRNGATYVPGKAGSAFSFDGFDDYVENNTSLDHIRTNFTMEFWAYPLANREATLETATGNYIESPQRFALFPRNGQGVGVGFAGAGVSVGLNGISVFEHSPFKLTSVLVYNLSVIGWTHVAVTYTNNRASLYVNGQFVRQGVPSQSGVVAPYEINNPNPVYGRFAGHLDEISIYNRALSPAEVLAIFEADGAAKCRALPMSVHPLAVNVGPGATVNFTGIGGAPPFNHTYSVTSASPAGTIDPVTGVYTAGNQCDATDVIRATDRVGVFVEAQVTIVDLAAPSIVCPADIVMECAGPAGTLVNFTPIATDDCAGALNIVCNPAPGSLFNLGETLVNCTATDASGKAGNCSFLVTVVDTTAPVLALNGPATVTIECHSAFTDAGATAVDSCAGAVTVSTSGSVNANAPGTYVLTYSATDAAGNSASTMRTVTVVDATAPVIALNGAAAVTVECHSAFADPGATANDLCSGALTVTTSGSVDVNTPDTYVLSYSATDSAGNNTVVTRTVVVVDTTAPAITACPPPTVTLTGSGVNCQVALPDYTGQLLAADQCGSVAIQQTPPAGHVLTAGAIITVTLTATDAAGNAATCSVNVSVNSGPPVFTVALPTQTLLADAMGETTVPNFTQLAQAIDYCNGGLPVTLTQSPAPGSRLAVGQHSLTLTATGAGGTTAVSTSLVIVQSQGLTVSGLVSRSGSGTPVVNQAMYLYYVRNARWTLLSSRTDVTGRFQFSGLPAGSTGIYGPLFSQNRFTPAARLFVNLNTNVGGNFTAFGGAGLIAAAGDGGDIGLPPELDPAIRGFVLDTNGLPLVGIPLRLTGDALAESTSGAEGEFGFESLPLDGTFVVAPDSAGRTFLPASVTVEQLAAPEMLVFLEQAKGLAPVPSVRLQVDPQFNHRLTVRWTGASLDYALEYTDTLGEPDWREVAEPQLQDTNEVIVPLDDHAGPRFFRLRNR